MKIDGSCHCGAITYEATVDPQTTVICHCSDCQTLSGAPFRASVPVKTENLHIRQGKPKVYVKTAASGNKRAQGFCSDCGSALYSADAENPKLFMLRLGAVKQRADLPPRRQIWCGSALPWAQDIGDVPGSAKG